MKFIVEEIQKYNKTKQKKPPKKPDLSRHTLNVSLKSCLKVLKLFRKVWPFIDSTER